MTKEGTLTPKNGRALKNEGNFVDYRSPLALSEHSLENNVDLSGRRSRRFKSLDPEKELYVIFPHIDGAELFGVFAREADDFRLCMEEVVEYEEDSDGALQPLAFATPADLYLRHKENIIFSGPHVATTPQEVRIPGVRDLAPNLPLGTPFSAQTMYGPDVAGTDEWLPSSFSSLERHETEPADDDLRSLLNRCTRLRGREQSVSTQV
jgi:hypothetical protein